MFIIRTEKDISSELIEEGILFDYKNNEYVLSNSTNVRELTIIQKLFNASFKQLGNCFIFVMYIKELK